VENKDDNETIYSNSKEDIKMYKSKEEVKRNVEDARRTNYGKNKEHNWFNLWRRLDKVEGKKKPVLYKTEFKF
jgi:hypothetical protein